MRFELKELAMEDMVAKDSRAKVVTDRATADVCLIDNCGCKAAKRGLCTAHYETFIRTRRSQPARERQDWERNLIHDGLVLARGAIRAIRNPNPFLVKAGE